MNFYDKGRCDDEVYLHCDYCGCDVSSRQFKRAVRKYICVSCFEKLDKLRGDEYRAIQNKNLITFKTIDEIRATQRKDLIYHTRF